MSDRNLAVLDTFSAGTLLAWFLFLISYFIFRPNIPLDYVDTAAWVAFGLPILLSWLPRWLHEISDAEIIGPLRLWIAACTVALLFCLAGSFIAAPKIATLQAQLADLDIPAEHREALHKSLSKTQNFAVQFLCIRAVLAIGLAVGTKKLPKNKESV